MKIIVLTGYTKEQFEKVETGGCYLCKRQVKDKGVFLSGSEDDLEANDCQLAFTWVERIKDNIKFRFPICNECLLLVEDPAEKQNPLINLIKRPNLN